MKLSLRWLGEMVDLSGTTPGELQRLLTFHTAEVEGVEHVGGGLEAVVTGRVAAVRPHPDADKLRLCTVETGEGREPVEVVCGAPNVAVGQVVAYAPEGSTLPGGPGGAPIRLERRAIRGVESRGMICSERELGLGDDHDGILVLPAGTPVGRPLTEVVGLEDDLLEVDNVCVTHRPDLWGHVGWARELAALLRRPFQPPAGLDPQELPAAGEAFPVRVDDPEGCRRYVGLVVEGLANGPSPLPLRRRLESLGVRSIDLLVDLTNLVLLEQGQPLHAFDLRDVRGGEIRVRRAGDGESMTTLDGQPRSLGGEDVVIADGRGPVAIAGVMGGENSEVRADTSAVLLEAATFDPLRVRRTATRLGLRTEASTRFEKSLDPELALQAALRFAALARQHCPGARFPRPLADAYPRPYPRREITLSYGLVRRRLGARIADHTVRAILDSLGFHAREEGDALRVAVPSWRATKDVERAEDLVEEVGRVAGYERVAAVAPIAPMVPRRPRPERALERRVAAVLSLGLGYAEVKHRSFYGAQEAERLGLGAREHLRVTNPGSEEHSHMIQSTAPALLQTVVRNQVRVAAGRVWEGARLFAPRPGDLPVERAVFALAAWERRDGQQAEGGALFLSLVEDVRSLLHRLGVRDAVVANAKAPALHDSLPPATWLHPGRTAAIRTGGELLAVVGEALPAVARRYDVAGRVVLAEIDAERLLLAVGQGASGYEPVLRYPVVPFDVAVVVPRRTPAEEVRRRLCEAVAGHVRDVHVFDVYEGRGIPEGQRSIALRCELFDREATLSSEAAEALRTRILAAFDSAGWSVRAG